MLASVVEFILKPNCTGFVKFNLIEVFSYFFSVNFLIEKFLKELKVLTYEINAKMKIHYLIEKLMNHLKI